jgi:urocanate hydratase
VPQSESNTQELILRTFTLLHALRQDWGGALILCCGLEQQGMAMAVASNIAGAVCLNIEEKPDALRDAMRSGSCDFIVNTLDEALRAIKNEIRKHLPLSVGLQGDTTAILEELLERGVKPELFTDLILGQLDMQQSGIHDKVARQFQSSGTLVLDLGGGHSFLGTLNADALLESFVQQRQWRLHSFEMPSQAALRAFDLQALELTPADDNLRRRWLQAAAKILQRERPVRRVLWATEEEAQRLQAKLG